MKLNVREWGRIQWIHILVWIIFIFYETIVVGLIFGIFGNPITYILHYIINISFFYFNSDFVLTKKFEKKINSTQVLIILLLLEIVAFILLNYFIDMLLIREKIIIRQGEFTLNIEYALKVLYRCIYFLSFSTAYFFLREYINEKKTSSDLEKLRLENLIRDEKMKLALTHSQNSFLKAQINPHFLFNTLNFIYHSIESNRKDAESAILILSDVMRYAIDATDEDGLVPLNDEIQQIENVLSLYQLRKANTLNLEISISREVASIRFIPLVLLTLLENMFKHGNLCQVKEKAYLKAIFKDQNLIIETKNLVNSLHSLPGTRNGLKNTESRLQYAFGENIVFNAKQDSSRHFIVRIQIPISNFI
jgi:two-component system LytT family sensor kinase